LFEAALALKPEERKAFLRQECGQDELMVKLFLRRGAGAKGRDSERTASLACR
jgi:hypothetical protein